MTNSPLFYGEVFHIFFDRIRFPPSRWCGANSASNFCCKRVTSVRQNKELVARCPQEESPLRGEVGKSLRYLWLHHEKKTCNACTLDVGGPCGGTVLGAGGETPAHLHPPKRLACAQGNGDVLQWRKNQLDLGLVGWVLGVGTEDLYMEMCFTMNKEPFRLKWGGLGFYGWGLRIYTCRCPTMDKQPCRLELVRARVLGGGVEDLYMEMFPNDLTTI